MAKIKRMRRAFARWKLGLIFALLLGAVGLAVARRPDTPAVEAVSSNSERPPVEVAFDGETAPRPNILIIITDDQRFDTMDYMPYTREHIFEQGVEFTNAYITTPRCCPSRASILTGMYAHNHGVLDNKDPLEQATFIQRLHESGYYTGQVGKYLNSYPTSVEDPPLPEFDYWVAFISGGASTYYDPLMNVNGMWTTQKGYQTYLLRDFALEFLREAAGQDQPFVLLFAPYAPHKPAKPAPGDENLYLDLPPHRPPSFNESDLSDKPRWLQESFPPLSAEDVEKNDALRIAQLQTLWSVDQSVESLLTELERLGTLDDTIVIFLSDNGMFWGEHRIARKKLWGYEETIRTPFALFYSRLVPRPYKEEQLVANIDIAPTIYDLVGIPIPPEVDGLSLIPLLQRTANWRDYLLIEGWPKDQSPPYLAIHTGRYIYMETPGDKDELYDLIEDPFQMTNVANKRAYADVAADLRARLAREKSDIQPTPMPES